MDAFTKEGNVGPVEARLEDLVATAEAQGMVLSVNQFSELLPGETLQAHVQAQFAGGASCPGPWIEVKGSL